MFTCSKIFPDIPFAHRQHLHKGHCRLIHGHNWAFKFTFGCVKLDDNEFVVDFGDLKWIKVWLEERFDHALVLNEGDPHLPFLNDVLMRGEEDSQCEAKDVFAKITVVPNCGAEGLAAYVGEVINKRLLTHTQGRVSLVSLEVLEDSKNSATCHFHTHVR